MNDVLNASFGKVKITPEEKASLAGYDPTRNVADPAKDILDNLYARIAILDDGQRRSMIVSVDCCLTSETTGLVPNPSGRPNLYREFINTFPSGTRRSWAEAAGVTEASVTVNATHTHHAPAHYSEKYTSRIQEKIREVGQRLVPVKLSVGVGESDISAYRRPTLRINNDVPVDQTLYVLWFESLQDEPLGSLVNFAVHPTSLNSPKNRVTTENVGWAMNDLEEEVGNGFISLFTQGFSGDVCPTYGGEYEREDTYNLVKEGGKVLCSDILRALNNKQPVSACPLMTEQTIIPLPTREGFIKSRLDVTLMGIRIGDTVILSVSGEVFNKYAVKIRKFSPFQHTLLSGLANGYSGYIPTHDAFHDGLEGYEMRTTPYTDEAEEILIREAVELLKALKG